MINFDETVSIQYDPLVAQKILALIDHEAIRSNKDLLPELHQLHALFISSLVTKYGCTSALMLQWCRWLWTRLEREYYTLDSAGNRYDICKNSARVTFSKTRDGKRVKVADTQWLHTSGRMLDSSDAHMAVFYYLACRETKSVIDPKHMNEFDVVIFEDGDEIRRMKINQKKVTGLHCEPNTNLDLKVLDTFLALSMKYCAN